MASAAEPTPSKVPSTVKASVCRIVQSVNPHALTYLDEAKRFNRNKRIHRRKVIPELAFGEVIGDAQPTRPLALDGSGGQAHPIALAEAAPPPINFDYNAQISDVGTADTASHVCEPTVAQNGNIIFVTGNWFACVSTDGGQNYSFVDPSRSFPDPPNSRFCCDQIAIYSSHTDLFFWLLQYSEDDKGENVQRIAYASTADVVAGTWNFFDISSKALGFKGAWLDYPDLAVSSTFLYMTTNAFRGNQWAGTAIARVSLASIVNGAITAEKVISKTLFNFRVAQQPEGTVYWASHVTNSRIQVYAWPDASPTATSFEIDVPTFNSDQPYRSTTPDNRDWLERVDRRMTGGTQAGQQLFFAWTAGAGGVNARPNPYVQIACVDIATRALLDSINLWDPVDAIACAALGTNGENEVGISYSIGGPGRFPSHIVGILTNPPTYKLTFAGQRGPNDRKWGDYLSVRRCHPDNNRFIASGYTLVNAAGNNDATPNITIFGR
ncbi:hypothetical protein [Rhizobium changzhiense]|uniref:Uncharacterized protein n=1 Tax=Rhizobium changzhiense TaxID=2692317 RepID=A0ABR6A127_9HYPH|nr:hypothetical protein [Rhizobium changzhiense]MBA5800318.1 hypothetical protein [Rhizobium changzhiense]